MVKTRNTFIILCLLCFSLPAPASHNPKMISVSYGQKNVELYGKIIRKKIWGPPGFENDGLSKKIWVYGLKLRDPMSISVGSNSIDEPGLQGIQNLNLIFQNNDSDYQFSKNKNTILLFEGQVVGKLKSWDVYDVTLIVSKIKSR